MFQGKGTLREELISEAMLEIFSRSAGMDGIARYPEAVVKAIVDCRAGCGGVPQFRDAYAQQPLITPDGKRYVMLVCWKGKKAGCGTIYFTDIPNEELKIVQTKSGEWVEFLNKFQDQVPEGLREQIPSAFASEIIV